LNTPNNYNTYINSSIELSNNSLKLNLNNNNIINITNDNINFSSNIITNKIIYVCNVITNNINSNADLFIKSPTLNIYGILYVLRTFNLVSNYNNISKTITSNKTSNNTNTIDEGINCGLIINSIIDNGYILTNEFYIKPPLNNKQYIATINLNNNKSEKNLYVFILYLIWFLI